MRLNGQTNNPLSLSGRLSGRLFGHLSGWLAAVLLVSGAAGCGGEDAASGPQLAQGTLALQRIDWAEALPAMTSTGKVAAVAESGDDVAVFSDTGLFLWSSGSTAGSDSSVRTWQAAAAVPALGFPGQWLLGVDDGGRVYRLHSGAAFSLEDVTARYVLTDKPVREVAALGNGQVVFALADKLALTDGQNLKLFDLSLRHIVGGPTRLAAYDETGVSLWDPQSGALRQFAQPGVIGVAFAPDGTLWAATAQRLFTESKGENRTALVPIHEFTPPQAVTSLAGAARGIWVGLGDTLALVRDGQLLLPEASPMLPADTRLIGSASGDVWTVASGAGTLGRYGEASGGGADLTIWRQQLVPIFNRLCQACHLPGGSARIDLSTYSSWAHLRTAISVRVVERKPTPMPPLSVGMLKPEELAAVQAWVGRMP